MHDLKGKSLEELHECLDKMPSNLSESEVSDVDDDTVAGI